MNKLISYIIGAMAYYTTSTSLTGISESLEIEMFENAPQVLGVVAAIFIVLVYRFLTGVLKFLVCIAFPLAFVAMLAFEYVEVDGKKLSDYVQNRLNADEFGETLEKVEEVGGIFDRIEATFDDLPKEDKERVANWVSEMVEGGAEISEELTEKIRPYLKEEA